MAKKTLEVKIQGMTCGSCELLIESEFQKIPGVKSVKVSQAEGKATLLCKRVPSREELQRAIAGHGYDLSPQPSLLGKREGGGMVPPPAKEGARGWSEIAAILIIIFGLYLIFKTTKILDFNLGISDNMSYGFIFLIGLVAASSSCIAVTGGVLLSVAAKYNESCHAETRWEKFKPHLLFNVGRVISYTVLGGLIGALGSVFSISPKMNGLIGLLAAFFMIGMGFHILKLFPSRFSLKMPKFIGHRILKLQEKSHPSIPFLMGALTFFLPCGFTQALQLYAISRGSLIEGALIMLFFSLGTLPALLSLGSISSFSKGKFQRYFLKFSGVLVLLLGFSNIQSSLNLLGFTFDSFSSAQIVAAAPARIQDGKQIVEMKVDGYHYEPSEFTVLQGVPVEWRVDGASAAGCGQIIIMPTMDLTAFLPKDAVKTITFTPKELGIIPFNCTMGMMTSGAAFHVIPNDKGIVGAVIQDGSGGDDKECDSALTSCNVQHVEMEISRERYFYPRLHTVKKNIPVEFIIDDQVDVGSCMGTLTIPDYGVAKLLRIGKNVVKFTPTKAGLVNAVCSMGMLQTTFNVIE